MLSPAELAGADGLIDRLDGDDDEMVTLAELRPHDNPLAGRFFDDETPAARGEDDGPIVPLTTTAIRQRVARRLIARFDGTDSLPQDQRLSRSELRLEDAAFRRADGDGDGAIDVEELERFLANPAPDLVLNVRLGRSSQSRGTIEIAGPEDGGGPLAAQVKTLPEGGMVLDLDGIEIRLSLNDFVRDFRRFLEMRFNDADSDKNGELDRKEAERARFFERVFDPADRNGDERLSRRELTNYLERAVDSTESRLVVTPGDSGRSLFELLDVDHDGRLGRRELRDAAKRLKRFDANHDDRVSLGELPRTFQLSVGRGPVNRRRGLSEDSYDDPPRRRRGGDTDAVSWFRHMDRNQDGDVSLREFLGSAADFRTLDADGDGLIDPREAAKGP
jgi:Ca2+-binding EF-hand superfamily protein